VSVREAEEEGCQREVDGRDRERRRVLWKEGDERRAKVKARTMNGVTSILFWIPVLRLLLETFVDDVLSVLGKKNTKTEQRKRGQLRRRPFFPLVFQSSIPALPPLPST